jgi:hypothetical protein
MSTTVTYKGLSRDSQGTLKGLSSCYGVYDECLRGISLGSPLSAGAGALCLRLYSCSFFSILDHAKQSFLLSTASFTRFLGRLRTHFYHTARTYEYGRLHWLKKMELYLTHWLHRSKSMSMVTLCSLGETLRATNRTCQDTCDVMINNFSQAMRVWKTTK